MFNALQLIIGIIIGAIIVLSITVVLHLSNAVHFSSQLQMEQNSYRRNTHPIPLFIFAWIEELFARAFLIGWLQRLTGLNVAFTISVIVFTVLHVPNRKPTIIAALNLLAVSILFGVIYLRYGLWVVVGVHYGWNLMQWTILGYPMYGHSVGRVYNTTPAPDAPNWLTGGDCGPEFSIAALAVLLILLAVLFWTGRAM